MAFPNIILAKLSEFFFFESKYEIQYSFRNHLNESNNTKTQKDIYIIRFQKIILINTLDF